MAELKLDSGEFTTDQLGKNIAIFSPAFEILVNGSKIADEIAISILKVESSLEGTADSFSFRLRTLLIWNNVNFYGLTTYLCLAKQ